MKLNWTWKLKLSQPGHPDEDRALPLWKGSSCAPSSASFPSHILVDTPQDVRAIMMMVVVVMVMTTTTMMMVMMMMLIVMMNGGDDGDEDDADGTPEGIRHVGGDMQ